MEKNMTPREKFIFDSLIINNDDFDGICKIKYLNDCKTKKGEDVLWVGANIKAKEVVLFTTNADDTIQGFEDLSCVDELTRDKIMYQLDPRIRQIVYRSMKKKYKEDLPTNFYTTSISQYMKEIENGTEHYGEVGVSGCTENPYMIDVSVYYPNKTNPSHTYDTPLYFMEQSELVHILDNLSEENNVFIPKVLEVEQSTLFDIPIMFTEVLKGKGVDETRLANYAHAKESLITFFSKHQEELIGMGIEVCLEDLDCHFREHQESILTEGVSDVQVRKFYEE